MNSNRHIRLHIISLFFVIFAINKVYGQSYIADTSLDERSRHLLDSMFNQPSGFQKFINYYARSNEEPKGKFTATVIGAPYYRSETNVGLGVVATGLYRSNWNDTISHLSDVSIIAKGSLSGFYSIELAGNHNSSFDRFRMYYDLTYNSFPQLYWGIGFANGDNNDTRTYYTRKTLHSAIKPTFKVANNLYIGPSISYDYIKGINFDSDSLLFGADPSTSALNLGAMVTYDSRDVTYNAYKGIYFNIEQRNYLHFGGNKPFFKTIADFRSYNRLWKGAVLAFRAYSEFSYGTVPWTMKAKGDGVSLLRAYYEGRYEDDNMLYVTLELRQRIWRRLGAVAWIGAGNMFSDVEPFDWKHTLSDIGVGLRYEFKKRINIRVDYGIGRCGQSSVSFSIREAF